MTLQEWADKNETFILAFRGLKIVQSDCAELYSLEDYVVTTRAGDTTWLQKKRKTVLTS